MLRLPGLEYRTITKVFFDLPSMWPTITFIVTSPLNTIPPLTVFKYLLMDRFHFVFLRHGKSAGICWAKLYFGGVQLLHHRPPSVEKHWGSRHSEGEECRYPPGAPAHRRRSGRDSHHLHAATVKRDLLDVAE